MGMLPQASRGRRSRGGCLFIKNHLIRVTEKSFDDFVTGSADQKKIQRMLGIG